MKGTITSQENVYLLSENHMGARGHSIPKSSRN